MYYLNLVIWAAYIMNTCTSAVDEGALYYKNSWIVEIPDGIKVAKSVASRFGFLFINPVWLFENLFVFLRKDFPLRQRFSNRYITNLLLNNEKVAWAEQQFVRIRNKKSTIVNPPRTLRKPEIASAKRTNSEANQLTDIFENIALWLGISKSDNHEAVSETKEEVTEYSGYFNDPMWNKQWYAVMSPIDDSGLGCGLSLMEVYKMNITGHGVRVAVVDDGVDVSHPDLMQNYDKEYSFDLNHNRSDVTPLFKTDGTRYTHGTKCAGVIAMAANNSQCGVGVAYNAKLAVIKMLEQPGVDVVEGQALRLKCEGIDIYSSSWGPRDNGKIMENMGTLSGKAIQTCLQVGRNGKGSIYLFPAGNGKLRGDNCGADAYSNSLYGVTIASATRWGTVTSFSEQCSAIFTTTYSRGPDGQGMVTTGPDNDCHNYFGSTSASVPIAAGIIALALQVKEGVPLEPGQLMEVVFDTSACSRTSNEVTYLEQIQLVPFIQYGCRGAISIQITSPTGTTSTLLKPRLNDISSEGLIGWPLKSVHFWGESPFGVWMLQTKIHYLHESQEGPGILNGFLLIFSGTFDKPSHYKTLPRTYMPFTPQD